MNYLVLVTPPDYVDRILMWLNLHSYTVIKVVPDKNRTGIFMPQDTNIHTVSHEMWDDIHLSPLWYNDTNWQIKPVTSTGRKYMGILDDQT